MHLQLTVTGEIKELPIESLEGDLTNTPAVAAQGKANILFLGQRLDGVDFVVADGILYGAITSGATSRTSARRRHLRRLGDPEPDTGLANVLANFTDPKADGRETVSGVETVRVTGNISADAVNKIAPQIGATGPVPGTAWIREDGNHELVQAKMEPPRQQRHDDAVGVGQARHRHQAGGVMQSSRRAARRRPEPTHRDHRRQPRGAARCARHLRRRHDHDRHHA